MFVRYYSIVYSVANHFKKIVDDMTKLEHIITMKDAHPQPPTFDEVMNDLRSVCDVIGEAIQDGTQHVQKYSDWEDGPIDYALAPNLVRHRAKAFLVERGQSVTEETDEEQHEFETENISNNGLCLDTPKYQVRILKSLNLCIPPPGKSVARNNFYKQLQGLLDFPEWRNGNEKAQPVLGIVVHWTVDDDYSLHKLSLALPIDYHRNNEGRLIVETVFDEPFWIKRPAQVTPIANASETIDLDLEIEEAADEKTADEPKKDE
jgi:hypothetical protein